MSSADSESDQLTPAQCQQSSHRQHELWHSAMVRRASCRAQWSQGHWSVNFRHAWHSSLIMVSFDPAMLKNDLSTWCQNIWKVEIDAQLQLWLIDRLLTSLTRSLFVAIFNVVLRFCWTADLSGAWYMYSPVHPHLFNLIWLPGSQKNVYDRICMSDKCVAVNDSLNVWTVSERGISQCHFS